MNFDELMMTRCLELAAAGAGRVSPNPLVGAVLVHEGRIIGEGYHQQYGGAHAEVNAIASVSESDQELIAASTLYVNLEPCNHYGKTPPCTDLIIRSQIKKVVIGCADPHQSAVEGGIQKMHAHGIDVNMNVLSDACMRMNRFFFTVHQKHRPLVLLKWAQSADGLISAKDGKPVRLTNAHADRMVHQWRATYDAILVGGRTVLHDDPKLTTRHWPGRNPLRIVIDTHGDLNKSKHIFNSEANTLIFNYNEETETGNLQFIRLDRTAPIIPAIMAHLRKKGISSLIVEGGAHTLELFISAGVWDEAKVFVSATATGSGIRAPQLPGKIRNSEQLFDNILITTEPV